MSAELSRRVAGMSNWSANARRDVALAELFAASADFANVLSYGALGDGVADDTTAITAAIAATPAGGSLYFPVGTYRVTSALALNRSITLLGAGRGAVIQQGATVSANTITVSADYANVRNLRVRGNGVASGTAATANAIYVADCNDVTIEGNWVENGGLCGIQVAGALARCRIRDNRITGTNTGSTYSQGCDIYVNSGVIADIEIVGNLCLSTTKQLGIAIQPSSVTIAGAIITHNVVNTAVQKTALLGYGIMLYCATADAFIQNVTIAENAIRDCEGMGIYVVGVGAVNLLLGIVVANNRLTNCMTVGTAGLLEDGVISIGGARQAVVTGNAIYNTATLPSTAAGIRVVDPSEGTIVAHNVLRSTAATANAIYQTSTDRTQILHNAIDGWSQGIRVTGGADGLIFGNAVRGVANDAILIEATAGVGWRVAFNHTKSSGQSRGVSLENNGVTVEHNRFMEGAVRDIGTGNLFRRNRLTTGVFQGRVALVNGTATVSTAEVQTADNILLTRVVATGTTRGILTVGTIVAGTSFVVRAEDLSGTLSADDDSTVFWEICH